MLTTTRSATVCPTGDRKAKSLGWVSTVRAPHAAATPAPSWPLFAVDSTTGPEIGRASPAGVPPRTAMARRGHSITSPCMRSSSATTTSPGRSLSGSPQPGPRSTAARPPRFAMPVRDRCESAAPTPPHAMRPARASAGAQITAVVMRETAIRREKADRRRSSFTTPGRGGRRPGVHSWVVARSGCCALHDLDCQRGASGAPPAPTPRRDADEVRTRSDRRAPAKSCAPIPPLRRRAAPSKGHGHSPGPRFVLVGRIVVPPLAIAGTPWLVAPSRMTGPTNQPGAGMKPTHHFLHRGRHVPDSVSRNEGHTPPRS